MDHREQKKRLDPDQDQWITGKRIPGEQLAQDQWSTWRTDGAGECSTRTKSSGSTESTLEDEEKGGARERTVGIQNRYAPPASKNAADGASLPLRHKINT